MLATGVSVRARSEGGLLGEINAYRSWRYNEGFVTRRILLSWRILVLTMPRSIPCVAVNTHPAALKYGVLGEANAE